MRFIIAGAPCAGKSTYVRDRARAGELVYDYDTLHQALSGQESHEHLDEIRPYVLAARDLIFSQLATDKERGAWIITSTRKQAELDRLAETLGAEVIFLPVDQAEAHRRATADNRPAAWHTYIDDWFRESDISLQEKKTKMHRKTYTANLQAKGTAGEVVAIFARLGGGPDAHGDITLPGAFGRQEVVIGSWQHSNELPVGKGIIAEEGDTAVLRGHFFDTTTGREHLEAVRGLGEKCEWSYQFSVLAARPGSYQGKSVTFLEKLEVFSVDPVLKGAGRQTMTLSVKNDAFTAAAARRQIAALGFGPGSPAETRAKVEAELDALDEGQFEAIAARLKASSPPSRAAMMRQAFLEEGHSPAWVDTMLSAELASIEQQIAQSNPAWYQANPSLARQEAARFFFG